jgi:hypothetical protein
VRGADEGHLAQRRCLQQVFGLAARADVLLDKGQALLEQHQLYLVDIVGQREAAQRDGHELPPGQGTVSAG